MSVEMNRLIEAETAKTKKKMAKELARFRAVLKGLRLLRQAMNLSSENRKHRRSEAVLEKQPVKPKRHLSAAGRKSISEAAKRRWAKWHKKHHVLVMKKRKAA